MLDWDRGLGTCQHCGEIHQLHTYKLKEDNNTVNYIRPVKKKEIKTSNNVIGWFEGRGISEKTLNDLKVSQPRSCPSL